MHLAIDSTEVLCGNVCEVSLGDILHAIAKTNGKICAAFGTYPIDAKLASDVGDTISDMEDIALLLPDMKANENIATKTECVGVLAEALDMDTVPNMAKKEILSSLKG